MAILNRNARANRLTNASMVMVMSAKANTVLKFSMEPQKISTSTKAR
ncbi:hypothetical protein PFLmoz3_01247 [Pseudomonas fluorescens]|uniref:Uncharacterized protein n=1 Tax=Pseudomonas fluorescens TaxID=294 RepID=A0A109LI78_PSEFL|nr:hypothetical protein PFLmoz3_01247 [Pseudomonas fluorescens]